MGVHIADVSYFVPEASELDKVAAKRATSVYLVQKVKISLGLKNMLLFNLLPLLFFILYFIFPNFFFKQKNS